MMQLFKLIFPHLVVMSLIVVSVYLMSAEYFLKIKQRNFKVNQYSYLSELKTGHYRSIKSIQEQEKMGFRLNMKARFEKKYLLETGFWQRCSGVRAWHLVGICFVVAALTSNWLWHLFLIEGLMISGFFLGFLLPLQILELFKMYRSYQLVNALPSFFGILLRWAQIQPDIYFCFGQLEQSGIHSRLSKPFKQFLIESTNGLSTKSAFENLAEQFEGTTMRHFISCLERLINQRGDLPKLLQGFEEETYQLQIEVTKRKLTQVKYKLLINGLCIGAFVLIYGLLKTNKVLSSFYVDTIMGKSLLSILSFLVVLSFLGGLHYDQD